MYRSLAAAVLLIALVSCASPPAPQPEPRHETKSLVPGTIGAVVNYTQGGVQVEALAPDGPAARAGLRAGDFVERCGDRQITTVRQFNEQVLATRPGERLRLDLRRDAEPLSVQVDVMPLVTALRP